MLAFSDRRGAHRHRDGPESLSQGPCSKSRAPCPRAHSTKEIPPMNLLTDILAGLVHFVGRLV
ncbi:hypothetical protein MTP06_14850 [Streptomyces sp. PLM4]|nr:hypothetical protein MTP06_14850 [Streptomyces sp. PLM4]